MRQMTFTCSQEKPKLFIFSPITYGVKKCIYKSVCETHLVNYSFSARRSNNVRLCLARQTYTTKLLKELSF